MLRELGVHIHVLKLQGYIFFGTANALLEQVRARVNDTQQAPVYFVILDFRRVTGLDSSAVISFIKGEQLAQGQGISLLLVSVSDEIRGQFQRAGMLEDGKQVHLFSDLDHGLEWCEDQLLKINLVTVELPVTLGAQLVQSGFEKADTARMMEFLEKREVRGGEYLIRQGDEADDLYFIESGGVSVYLELEDGKQVRLQSLSPGTVVGELGFYLDKGRSASVIADFSTTAYRLTRSALVEMRAKEPDLAAVFHEFVVRLLSERLIANNRLIEAVLR